MGPQYFEYISLYVVIPAVASRKKVETHLMNLVGPMMTVLLKAS